MLMINQIIDGTITIFAYIIWIISLYVSLFQLFYINNFKKLLMLVKGSDSSSSLFSFDENKSDSHMETMEEYEYNIVVYLKKLYLKLSMLIGTNVFCFILVNRYSPENIELNYYTFGFIVYIFILYVFFNAKEKFIEKYKIKYRFHLVYFDFKNMK